MVVTRKAIAEMLINYINREIDIPTLVDWAEDMIKEADFENGSFELIRGILAHIGLADVRGFGLTWDDCCNYLRKLGYNVKVELLQV